MRRELCERTRVCRASRTTFCCKSVREFWTLTHVPWRRAFVGKEPVHRSWARVLALADKVLLLPTRGVVPSEVDLQVVGQARRPQQVVERGRKEACLWYAKSKVYRKAKRDNTFTSLTASHKVLEWERREEDVATFELPRVTSVRIFCLPWGGYELSLVSSPFRPAFPCVRA